MLLTPTDASSLQIFSPAEIASNPAKFLNTDWIHDVSLLRVFLQGQQEKLRVAQPSAPAPQSQHSSIVKNEPKATRLPAIKAEPAVIKVPQPLVKTRESVQDGHDVIEILDSDDEEMAKTSSLVQPEDTDSEIEVISHFS